MAFLGSGMAAGMAIAGATGAQILAAAAAVGGAVGGFVSGGILTGTLQGALTGAAYGALSGGIAGYIGGAMSGGIGRSLAHGVSQGAISEARGGSFRAGFWSGLAGSVAPVGGIARGSNSAGAIFARTAAAAVLGGTASRLGGGKFANGAVTGAFVHLFNAEAHTPETSSEETLANKVAGKLMSGITKLKDFMGLGRNPMNTPSVMKGAAGKGFGGVAAAGISVLNVDSASAVTDMFLYETILNNYSDPVVQIELLNMINSNKSELVQRLRQDALLRREGE